MSNTKLWADVLKWRKYEQEQRQIIRDCRSMPSEYGHLTDSAEVEADYARDRRISALQSIKLHHLAAFHEHRSTAYRTAAE
jgi:hypothetical protein